MDVAALQKSFEEEDDQMLVANLQAGDTTAFARLMRRYNRRLFRVARSILKQDGEAEEAVQDAYVKAWKALPGFRFEARLSTWLTRIVINESLSRLRQERRRNRFVEHCGDTDMDRFNFSDAHVATQSDQSPHAMVLRAQMRELIERKLDELPDAYRTIFIMRAVEEMPATEVASVLGIPEATVRTRFFRARHLMQTALASEIGACVSEAFSFDGARCDRIVARVLARLSQ